MSSKTLADLAKAMKDIDFCMMTTKTSGGALAARPMSTNRDVEYDGDSWFFSDDSAHLVGEIEADKAVGLSFQGKPHLLGKPPIFIAVEGDGEIIRDKAMFAEHWNPDLERWFAEGIDTPGMVLIRVHAARLHYWDGEDEGEVAL